MLPLFHAPPPSTRGVHVKAYIDAHNLPEDERIKLMGEMAMQGKVVGFVVEDDDKANRYVRKFRQWFPDLIEEQRGPGPVPNTVFVRIGRRPETMS